MVGQGTDEQKQKAQGKEGGLKLNKGKSESGGGIGHQKGRRGDQKGLFQQEE